MIEGNLLTICASFPTIRRFFYLVAPRWIGESERKSSHNNALNQQKGLEETPLRTFGAATTRKELDTIGLTKHDDVNAEPELGDGIPTKARVRGGDKASRREGNESDDTTSACGHSVTSSFETIHVNHTWDPRPVGDEREAERAIVHARSYRVTRQSNANV